jgi:hypothetical protein
VFLGTTFFLALLVKNKIEWPKAILLSITYLFLLVFD